MMLYCFWLVAVEGTTGRVYEGCKLFTLQYSAVDNQFRKQLGKVFVFVLVCLMLLA